jgi:hypothetical protein
MSAPQTHVRAQRGGRRRRLAMLSDALRDLIIAVATCLKRSTDILLISALIIYFYAIVGMQTYGVANLGCGPA